MNLYKKTLSHWTFKNIKDNEWYQTNVPGTVHTDLLDNDLIPEPFKYRNEVDLQWIDKCDWIYKTEIEVDDELFNHDMIEITFEGLDTYTEIYVNHELILTTDNMFRVWVIDIKNLLKIGINTLEVIFKSPIEQGKIQSKNLGISLPAPNDDAKLGGVGGLKLSPFTRKSPYHYGWDWGPRFVTSGIWRDVSLKAWNHFDIRDVYVQQKEVSSAQTDLVIHCDIYSVEEKAARIVVKTEGVEVFEDFELKVGMNHFEIPMIVEEPKLWWIKQYGEPYLYEFVVELDSGEAQKQCAVKTGLRSIKLKHDPDEFGSSFHFELNGQPVFIKGANYIPSDAFLPSMDEEKYRQLVATAVDSGMNMLRVWGGGIYEVDEFYRYCDEMGILVWQDFIFACSMYPGNAEFLESVEKEAEDNIRRLRNHPSLALWCGNNEIDVMWKEYSASDSVWKTKYSEKEQAYLWESYQKIFHQLLPEIVNKMTAEIPYWPSSPLAELSHNAQQHASITAGKGDNHFWNVWHSFSPIEDYQKFIGRFMSEYGFQSFPDKTLLNKYLSHDAMALDSEEMQLRQKTPVGNELLQKYIHMYYGEVKNFDSFIYLSQCLQAYAYETAILAHRTAKPYCMGTLYWQLNDAWPGASWSTLDYELNWKATHYKVKQVYQDVVLAIKESDSELVIECVSDLNRGIETRLVVNVRDFSGGHLKQFEVFAEVGSDSVVTLFVLDKYSDILLEGELEEYYLDAKLYDLQGGEIACQKFFYKSFVKYLKDAHLEYSSDGYTFTISSDKLARFVKLSLPMEGHFSENYFDLDGGASKRVEFYPRNKAEVFIGDLKIESMKDHL